MDDMKSLWAKINAAAIPGFTGPLTLVGGYAIATFLTDLAALKTAYTTAQVRRAGDIARTKAPQRHSRSGEHRTARLSRGGGCLFNTLPRLSPEPDSPPDAVVATTSWDAATQQARITCTASTDPNLSYYDIRDCASPDYTTETESVVGSIDPASPLKFLTAAHLINPGNIASFKA